MKEARGEMEGNRGVSLERARHQPRPLAQVNEDQLATTPYVEVETDNNSKGRSWEDADQIRRIVGEGVRKAREAQGISARRLATECGLTSGFVSQIENGKTMPSVSSLVRICTVLRIPVSQVFGDLDEDGGSVRLVKAAMRKAYSYPGTGIRDEVVSSDPDLRVEVLHSVIAPGGSTGKERYTHRAEVEVVFVVSGQVTVAFEDGEYRLHAGDALTFPGSLPHRIRNEGRVESESIWVLAPATY